VAVTVILPERTATRVVSYDLLSPVPGAPSAHHV